MSGENSGGRRLAERYVKELSSAARVLPQDRRAELVQDVRSHIEEALAEADRDDPAAVRAVLDGLGEPDEIVAAALADVDGEPVPVSRGMTGSETAAVLLLLFGALAAGLGWLVGLLLLWASPRWTLGDKLLGTFVLPGGVVLPALLAAAVANGSLFGPIALLAVGVVAPLLAAARLVQRARTASVVDGSPRWGSAIWAVCSVVLAVPVVGVLLFTAEATSQGPATPATVSVTASIVATHSPSS
jgi:hypothetical protein